MVDVTHDGYNRRTAHQLFICIFNSLDANFNVAFGNAFECVAEFVNDKFGGVSINRLGYSGHNTHFHQSFNDIGAAFRHSVGQLLNSDEFWKDDLTDNLLLRFIHGQTGLFAGTAHGGH